MKKKPEEMSHGSDIDLYDEQIICLLHPLSSPPSPSLFPLSLPFLLLPVTNRFKERGKRRKQRKKKRGENFNI
jgi:hypothetical protein